MSKVEKIYILLYAGKGLISVNKSLVQPYFYQAVKHSCFLHLNEQQILTLTRSSGVGKWEQKEILQQTCSRFVAAPDGNDCLHVIAADSNNQLFHIMVTKDQVQTKPFFINENSGPFLLSFSVNGLGYFFYIEDNESCKLKAAKYSPASGWKEELSPEQSHSVPVSLAIDNSGGIHLLLYELTNGSLNYHFRSQMTTRWAEPFQLDSALELSLLPSLWVTAGHNIHIAWFLPRKNTVCYRMKRAGGWPVGGWQHEQYLPLNTPPRLISFYKESETVKVWCIGTGNKLAVFSLQNGNWQMREETNNFIPLRHGTLGGELCNLADTLPPTSLLFSKVPSQTTTEHTVGQMLPDQNMQLTEEKRSLTEDLLATIRKMEEEYRQWQNENKTLKDQLEQVQNELSAKEAARKEQFMETDTLRQELTNSKQQAEGLLAAIRKKEEETRQWQNENKSLKEQLKQVQKKLNAKETAIKDQCAKIDSLRSELSNSRQQMEDQLAAVRKREKEQESRKGILGRISSPFHKKE